MSLLNLMIQFFILIGAGCLLNRVGALKAQAGGVLTSLILNLLLPCSVLLSFANASVSDQGLVAMLGAFLGSVGYILLAFLLNRFLYRRFPKDEQPAVKYATMIPNCAFLGNPVCESAYGAEGLMLASIYQLFERVVVWVFAPLYFDQKGERGIGKTLRKLITNPCVDAVIAGLILMFFKIEIPAMLRGPLEKLGACSTPLSMVLVGQVFSSIRLRDTINPRVLYFCLLRLIVIPAAVYLLCAAFGGLLPAMSRNVIVLMAALPAGTVSVILASRHGMGEQFASKCLVLSTLFSCITLPLWNYLLAL